MQLENIELAKLSVSPANMRNGKKPPDISDILPSVRVRGVLVPLLVRPTAAPKHSRLSRDGGAIMRQPQLPKKAAAMDRSLARYWKMATMPPRWRPRSLKILSAKIPTR